MILFLFLQGYLRFMKEHFENKKKVYVNFDCRKTLTVVREGMTQKTSKLEDWRDIFDKYTKKITEEIEENMISN